MFQRRVIAISVMPSSSHHQNTSYSHCLFTGTSVYSIYKFEATSIIPGNTVQGSIKHFLSNLSLGSLQTTLYLYSKHFCTNSGLIIKPDICLMVTTPSSHLLIIICHSAGGLSFTSLLLPQNICLPPMFWLLIYWSLAVN